MNEEEKRIKRLKEVILGRGSNGIIRYKTELGTVYFIPKEIKEGIVHGFAISPNHDRASHPISLKSLLEQEDIYISNFRDLERIMYKKKESQ